MHEYDACFQVRTLEFEAQHQLLIDTALAGGPTDENTGKQIWPEFTAQSVWRTNPQASSQLDPQEDPLAPFINVLRNCTRAYSQRLDGIHSNLYWDYNAKHWVSQRLGLRTVAKMKTEACSQGAGELLDQEPLRKVVFFAFPPDLVSRANRLPA